jgi:phosphoribosylglycinamide formyltransferase-1
MRDKMGKKRLGVLISGSGTNLQSIIDNIEEGYINNAEISVVISNKETAFGLKRAEKHNIPTAVVSHKEYKTREEFEKKIIDILEEYNIDYVILAGFMRVLSNFFITYYKNRILNIHPALLPSFPGVDAQKQAFDYGVRFSGCTVHFVDTGVDTGPIILQAVVPVLPDDTEETLKKRILAQEHKIYPYAIKLLVEDKLAIIGRKVKILDDIANLKDIFIINPFYSS